jgi:WD40 repeat protein
VRALAFAGDGQTLVSGSMDGTVKLWHVAAGQELATLEKHAGPVYALVISPDGTTLATGGEDPDGNGEVYLWRAGSDFTSRGRGPRPDGE